MSEFGLTGGIGSGKSSVSKRLEALGAGLVDADATVKRLQRAGEPVFASIVEHFGPAVVDSDGELDRAAIAEIVFNDEIELKALNAIVHPAVRSEMDEQRRVLAKTHDVMILDIPLLIEGGKAYADLAGTIVVDLPVEIAVFRLVEFRGFTAHDAESRVKSQTTRQKRLDRADFVVDNSGTLDDLDAEVARCWQWIHDRLDAAPAAAGAR